MKWVKFRIKTVTEAEDIIIQHPVRSRTGRGTDRRQGAPDANGEGADVCRYPSADRSG